MWFFGSESASAVRPFDHGVIEMNRVFNLVAEGHTHFLACSTSLEAGRARTLRQVVEAGPEVMTDEDSRVHLKRRLVRESVNVILFGANRDKEERLAWLMAEKWKRTLHFFTLKAEAEEEILRNFSFLHIDSTWEPDEGFSSDLPHEITDYLFLGDYSAAQNELIVTHLNIRNVINASGMENAFADQIRYLEVNVDDSYSVQISTYFEDCIKFIDEARARNERVLTHCAAGISRSTTIVVAYLMAREGMDLKTAFLHVKKIRSIVEPNPGFARQLLEYERQIHGRNSISIPEGLPEYYGIAQWIRREMELVNEEIDPYMKRLLSD